MFYILRFIQCFLAYWCGPGVGFENIISFWFLLNCTTMSTYDQTCLTGFLATVVNIATLVKLFCLEQGRGNYRRCQETSKRKRSWSYVPITQITVHFTNILDKVPDNLYFNLTPLDYKNPKPTRTSMLQVDLVVRYDKRFPCQAYFDVLNITVPVNP